MNTLGKISLLLSLFCFLLSLGFRLAISGWIPFIGWGFAFGCFFLLFSLAINFRFFLQFLKSESLHFIGKSFLAFFVVLAILVVLNFILYKRNWTVDLTSNRLHSLSDLTESLVKALPEPLIFHYFHVDNATVRGYEPKVREFLQPYLRLNSQLKLQSHSIFKEPELAKKFKTGNEESTLFLEFKGRIGRISDLTETSVTNAILKISKAPKKIYFLTEHDERRVDDENTFGIKGIKDQLERLHYKVESLDNLSAIPDDEAMLCIVGPRKALSEEDIGHLQNYLDRGGALFVAADPGEDHNLNALLQKYGITLENHFVFSEVAQAGQSELLVLTHAGQLEHEVARSLADGENPALFISATLSLDSSLPNIKISPILEHLPNSVSRSDISPESEIVKQGRQVAGAIAEGVGEKRFRLAVVADGDFMTNQFYAQPSNFNFLLGIVTYLSQDEDLLKMRLPRPETTYLIMTSTNMKLYFLFFLLPFCLIFFVVALFFKMRRFF